MADKHPPQIDADDTVVAGQAQPEQSPGPTSDETILARPDSTRVVRGPAPPAPSPFAPAAGPAQAPERPAEILLERHLGPPPPAQAVSEVQREGLPSLRRKERRFRLLALIGLGLTVLFSGLGLWAVWYLW